MEAIYLLIALVAAVTAWHCGRDPTHPSRWRSTAFFAGLAVLVGAAGLLPAAVTGAGVLGLLLLGSSGLGRSTLERPVAERAADAAQLRHRLFWPALLLPAAAIVGALALKTWPLPGVPPERLPLVALAIAAALGLLLALHLTGSRAREVPPAGARLLDALGWAGVLPLLLAVLGNLLAQAGTADAVSQVVRATLPTESWWVCLLAYGLGMAALTAILGNAFAAFPVLAGAIGVPLLVVEHGANPAPMAAIGMLCGYCGTLLSPIAANFNLVPAALLDLPRFAVIRAQVATALPLLACNLVLMAVLLWW